MKKLKRTTFEVNRALEFFSEKELEMQIGHGKEWWGIALLKELIDNSLDACEIGNIAPSIEVKINNDSFSVKDNGLGIPTETISKSLNYLNRVSDKTFYVSPTRGQMGNALKTVWAAPFVMDGKHGKVEIWSKGIHHIVDVSIDRIAQIPVIGHKTEESDFVKNGTFVKIWWENSTSLIERKMPDFYNQPPLAPELIEGYSAFNPHSTFQFNDITYNATNPKWNKWRPDNPTSPHWYTTETLRDLIAAYVADEKYNDKVRTVREFVSEFRGLSSTGKQKQVTEGFSGVYLHDLIKDDDIDMELVQKLHLSMKEKSKPPTPSILGLIGSEHFTKWMVNYAGVCEESIHYVKRNGVEFLPHIVEVAFGVQKEDNAGRRILTGLNWSSTLGVPITMLQELIGEMRIDKDDPVTLIVHLTRPRFEFVDRGKTRLNI